MIDYDKCQTLSYISQIFQIEKQPLQTLTDTLKECKQNHYKSFVLKHNIFFLSWFYLCRCVLYTNLSELLEIGIINNNCREVRPET